MKGKSRKLSKLILSLSIGIGFVANAYAQTIKIGVNEPLTGPFAASGTYVANGAKIAADEINARGGILGKQLELVVEDNKSNPTEAAAVTERLITGNKVAALMGAWGSTLTLAAMPKLLEYKVPMLVETSSSGKITTLGNPYVFRISPPSSLEAKGFAPLVAKLGIKKVDYLVLNNDWGRGVISDFGEMFKKAGVATGRTETMDQTSVEMGAQLSNIKSSDADTLIVTTGVEQLTLVLKQAQSLGLKKRIVTTGGSQNPDQLIEQAGKAADGSFHLVTFLPWLPNDTPNPEITKYFLSEWKKRGYDFAGTTESFRGYDGIRTIAAAVEKAGSTDPAAITAALWQVEVKGLNGTIKFNKSGPKGKESGQSEPGMYLIQIVDGKVTLPKF
ncbi:MAG: ABC transporter substrate-binding protein [Afipia sp.]|nr:ABC transporter substrate-binding protein [Afipia sp.]OJW63507.1 MAG: ABC transporter substrate-binding protein [Afipia sp. 64-13]